MNLQYLAYLCDRIQKITEAVYRVTDLLHDKEPLKWKIREDALNIFTKILSLQQKNILDSNHFLTEIDKSLNNLLVVFSLLTGCDHNSISAVNFDILKDEYESVKKFINEQKSSEALGKISARNNLGLSIALDSPNQDLFVNSQRKKTSNGHSNGQHNGHSNGHSNGQIKNVQKKIINKNKNQSLLTKLTNPNQKGRKNKIYAIVKEKKEVSVSDLASIFPQYSEKTLQRDLLEMVKQGLLKKEGNKRWRRYVLSF